MLGANELEFAARTDTGLVRSRNEDAIAIEPEYDFAVLADGMGGYNAGEVASHIATQVVCQILKDGLYALFANDPPRASHLPQSLHRLVVDALQRANASILEAARADPLCSGMGTTLIAAMFRPNAVYIAHVGDSRAYRFRDGILVQLTRDHSLIQGQIDAGLIDPHAALYSPHRNLLTRALGIAAEMEVEVHDYETQAGDLYLLCSDGLSDMLPDDQIADLLTSSTGTLDRACEDLVEVANRKGGIDNISVIVIKLASLPHARSPRIGRIFPWIKRVSL
jgi:serine/threonine protein phosphatase PrpC